MAFIRSYVMLTLTHSTWLMALYDPAKEVSAKAQAAFELTFNTPEKRVKTLLFCKGELTEVPLSSSSTAVPTHHRTGHQEHASQCD